MDYTVVLYVAWTHWNSIIPFMNVWPPWWPQKLMGHKMRSSRKWKCQLQQHFGDTNEVATGSNTIQHDSGVHNGHFKRKIRSLDPRVQILWPLEKFGSTKSIFLMYFFYFWIFDQLQGRLKKTTQFVFKLHMNAT